MVVLADLVHELKALRKGRGIYASHIGQRVGPALRAVCGVTAEDGPAVIRRKVAAQLEELSAGLPPDLRVAVLAAFAISPATRLPLYQDRITWVAAQLDRDPRTARRRIDEGIHQLAELASIPAITPVLESGLGGVQGWRMCERRIALVLDRNRPEALEQHRVVSDRDGVAELDLGVGLAQPYGHPHPHDELDVNVLYGGDLIERRVESVERRCFSLALPSPLARGEAHDFALFLRLPAGQSIQPKFVCVPNHPWDLLDLRVRFDRSRLPSRISVVRNAFHRDFDDPDPDADAVSANAAGEIHLTFRALAPGLAYGIRWDQ